MTNFKKNLVLVFVVALTFILGLNAQPIKYEEGKVYRHKLENGLTVLTMERHIAPLVYHQLTYNVGSRNEKLGITGISHVVEHMMFKGTEKYGKGEASKTISKNSGIFNAFTSNDMTSYYEYIPSNKLEVALDIESDRMMNCVFNPNEFKSEIDVIIQERRMRSESNSGGVMREVMNSMLFNTHPNRDPIIGWPSDLRHITRDDAYKYYKTYYTPNNAFLVLVGDFETDKIIALVEKYYGKIPAGPKVDEVWAVQEPQKVRKSFTIYHNDIAQRSIRLAFVAPNYKDSNAAALKLAGMILCERSRDARLHKKLVEEKSIAVSVAGGFGISKDPTMFQISATVKPDSSIDKVEKMLWEEINLMKKEAVTDHELQKVKNRFKFAQETSYIKNSDIGTRMSQYEAYYGWDFLAEFQKRVMEVKKEDIISVMKKYFDEEIVTVAYAYPKEGGKKIKAASQEDDQMESNNINLMQDVFYYQSPEFQNELLEKVKASEDDFVKPKQIAPMIKTMKLKNGMTLYAIENHLTPSLSIVGTFETGFIPENLEGQKPGLVGLLADLMNRGPKNISYEQLSERMAFVPFSFGVGGSYKSFYFQGNSLIENVDEMMKTGFSIVTEPALLQNEMEKLRVRHIIQAKSRMKSTSMKAFYHMYNTIFEGHPLTKYFSTEQTLKSITREDINELHKKYFQPKNATLLMVGDMSPQKMKELADKYFGNWKSDAESFKMVKAPKVKELNKKVIKVFPEKDYTECTINIGFAPNNNVDPDEEEITTVMNYILAGSALTSRMGVELRDKQGLVYGIKSEPWSINEGIGYWKFNTKTAPKNVEKVITGIFSEIKKFFEFGITDEELKTAKDRQLGLLPFFVETPDDVASRVFELLQDKKPFNFFDKKAERIQKVTKEDVMRIAKKYFTLDKYVVVVDGPIEENSLDKLSEQL
ncbi:MAG: hypothetical protein A2499_17990 [Stygiobacter sp. RIFOXYC12_FULL_38_8]|nr:MAG: hypothetical protein A2279_08030 [Stygiobacter sp. RIFOXYA12_FULL_38_9]OGV06455.1 MAG: hypothetical protein A2299_15325 [Stygiobacter sp. RIFOXYB2_FULL_37_11]OGV14051.1 MAG: hypothetical protein A2440_19020 [Stygiobacter sp. RIFOXYC2_FULL_38_25]OGV29561.1 MAG: hypothetical protein A2499_17990 [Stygiobacter sp. RIFOXYC12_FULL_38_8]OGV82382.1 MAG: hypothetical protein A2X65_18505 [Stygiobacter sp. GWF2_38_21]